MSDAPSAPPEAPKGRRWFVVLAIITLVGFAGFTAAVTVLALRIPELKKPHYGVREMREGVRYP